MNRRPRIPLLWLLLAFTVIAPATARALEWTKLTATAVTTPFQKSLVLTFPFRNRTAAPALIRDIQTNCDCINAVTDKPSYAPGEPGVLTATFTVGERYGRYERTITVTSSDNPAPVKLTAVIESPELALLTP
ncbi:MAG: DUF1573 domain-containing protein, partial [Opitutales bacterium]